MTDEAPPSGGDIELRFEHPPVSEVVVDIDCELPPEFEVAAMEGRSAEVFGGEYPIVRRHFLHQQHISLGEASEPEVSSKRALEALRYFRQDEEQLVQIRSSGYSFNRLRPYPGFEQCLQDIGQTWRSYREAVEPLEVRELRLRFINQIEIPFESVEKTVELDEYLAIGPKLPDDDRLQMAGFLHRHQVIEPSSGNRATITLNDQSRPEAQHSDRLSILFDIATARHVSCEPSDWSSVEQALRSLRNLKNLVFRRTLTRRCLELFTPLR